MLRARVRIYFLSVVYALAYGNVYEKCMQMVTFAEDGNGE